MLVLPIPIFVALVLSALLLRNWFGGGRMGPLAWLLALCAVQSVIIALARHYGIEGARLVQPITAVMIPALAWLSFVWTAVRPRRAGDVVHLVGPVVAVCLLVSVPDGLDALIPLLFTGYGLAILMNCLRGSDALPQVKLDTGPIPRLIWLVLASSLMVSALSDVLIVVSQIMGLVWIPAVLLSVLSAVNLLLVGLLSLRPELIGAPAEMRDDAQTDDSEDREIMAALSAMMIEARPYLDPDLTLIKLARKLGVPGKSLSRAINRSTGESVSRYVNGARISAAQEMLRAGKPVTSAMLEAGFNTKSNFNREFLRVTGQTPSLWRDNEGTA